MFGLEHRHDSHYYENIQYRDKQRAIKNYQLSGDRKYLEPYLGWYNPNRGNVNVNRTTVGGTATTRRGK